MQQFSQEDGVDSFNLNNNPEVLQYTGDVPFTFVAKANAFLSNYDPYYKTGMGSYAVIYKTNNEFLGWCGLKLYPKSLVVDLGFRFYKNQ